MMPVSLFVVLSFFAVSAFSLNSGIHPDAVLTSFVDITPRAQAVEAHRQHVRGGLPAIGFEDLSFESIARARRHRRAQGQRLASRATPPVGTGRIQVFRADTGVPVGYIGATLDGQNSFTIAQSNFATFTITKNNSLADLRLSTPISGFSYLGQVGGSQGYTFASGQTGYTYFAPSDPVPAGSPPSTTASNAIQSAGYNGPTESAVWTIANDGSLVATWVNDNGVSPATFLASAFYDPKVNYLGLVGDFDKFQQIFPGEGAFLVVGLTSRHRY